MASRKSTLAAQPHGPDDIELDAGEALKYDDFAGQKSTDEHERWYLPVFVAPGLEGEGMKKSKFERHESEQVDPDRKRDDPQTAPGQMQLGQLVLGTN